MTIAAGFVCADGLVLGADRLITATGHKQYRRKTFMFSSAKVTISVTGAGSYGLLKLAAEEITERVKAAVIRDGHVNFDWIKHQVVERVVDSIYTKHIDRASDWERVNGYSLRLLIGAKCGHGLKLWESELRSVTEVSGFQCVGGGEPVANYMAATLFSPTMSHIWGRIIAAYLLQQTKVYGDGCGGNSDMIVIPREGPPIVLEHEDIAPLEQIANVIHERFGPVMAACSNPTKEGQDLEDAINWFRDGVEQARLHNVFEIAKQNERRKGGQAGPPSPTAPKRAKKGPKPSRA